MSEKLEVGLIILAAVAVAILAIRLAWGIVEEIVDEVRDERKRRAVMVGSRHLDPVTGEEWGSGKPLAAEIAKLPTKTEKWQAAPNAWSWPADGEHLLATRSVEPVRQSFRSYLEGGPDYRG